MCHIKIILVATFFMLAGCGKSPLLNKLENTVQDISGQIQISEVCSGEQIVMTVSWIIPPSLDELGVFDLELSSPMTTTQKISAYIWMPEMGHGSSPIEIKKIDETHYNFSEVAFIMPGLWVLHIEINEGEKVCEKWQKSIVL